MIDEQQCKIIAYQIKLFLILKFSAEICRIWSTYFKSLRLGHFAVSFIFWSGLTYDPERYLLQLVCIFKQYCDSKRHKWL